MKKNHPKKKVQGLTNPNHSSSRRLVLAEATKRQKTCHLSMLLKNVEGTTQKSTSLNYLTAMKTVRTKVKRFKQTKAQSFIPFICPDCDNVFGIETNKVECQTANVHFNCPHCGGIYGID